MSKFKTFKSKANQIHNNKYAYVESSYTDQRQNTTIICPFHGVFEDTPRRHIEGKYPKGCPECPELYPKITRVGSKMNTLTYIAKAKEKHGDKYDYSKTNYTGSQNKVTITCPIHGDFEQRANQHLYGNGCLACAREATLFSSEDKLTEQELKSKLINDNKKHIDIDFKTYTGWTDTTLKCTCPEHGEFITSAKNFHKRVHGCIDCTENLHSHSRSNYIKIAKRNMKGKARLYVIRCWSDDEEFYKVGITTRPMKMRFYGKVQFPYEWELVQEIIDDAENIWNLEKVIKRLAKGLQYTPKQYFNGITECFKL